MTYGLEKYRQLADENYYRHLGKVVKIVGLTIESVGPNAKLSDLCRIIIDKNKDIYIMAEVVGFRDKRLLLMPYESVEGLGVGCIVENTGHPLSVCVGTYSGWYGKTYRCRVPDPERGIPCGCPTAGSDGTSHN